MLLPKKPVQGIWGTIEKMLEKYGALNKKYDSNLDGVVDNADKVDGHDAGTSAGNVLVLDTAGQVPLANLPPLPASQLGFSFAWEFVGSISETGVSSIEFSNLAGDTDKLYLLILTISNPTTSTSPIFARFNADTVIGHYAYVNWYNNAGTVSTSTQSFGATTGTAGVHCAGVVGSNFSLYAILIYALGITYGTNTYVTLIDNGYISPTRYDTGGGAWIKQAEVTSITIFSGAGVNLDWTAYLFKPKW